MRFLSHKILWDESHKSKKLRRKRKKWLIDAQIWVYYYTGWINTHGTLTNEVTDCVFHCSDTDLFHLVIGSPVNQQLMCIYLWLNSSRIFVNGGA